MRIGYARVSTARQAGEGTSLETQCRRLKEAGAEKVIQDGGRSGATTDRPGLAALRAAVRPGDTVLVTKLDRLGRKTCSASSKAGPTRESVFDASIRDSTSQALQVVSS